MLIAAGGVLVPLETGRSLSTEVILPVVLSYATLDVVLWQMIGYGEVDTFSPDFTLFADASTTEIHTRRVWIIDS